MKDTDNISAKRKGLARLVAGAVFIATPMAAQAAGLADVFKNILEVVEPGVILLSAICYLAGAGLIAWSFFTLRSLGGQQARQEPGKFAGIVAAFVAGVGLVYLPTSIETAGDTVYQGQQESQGQDGSLDLN